MNVIDKHKAAEGLCYNFTIANRTTEKQIDALMAMRDIARSAGIILSADEYGRIVAHTTDGEHRQIAIGLFI